MLMDMAQEEGITVTVFSKIPQDTEAQETHNKLKLMQQVNPEGFEAAQSGLKEQIAQEAADGEGNKKSFLKMENENASTV